MHPTIFLAGLAAVIPVTLAEELRAADVPSACKTICQPIVDLTNTCDIDPKEADNDNDKGTKLRLRERSEAEESIEANCICTNKSFDVAAVMALCASCMVQNSQDTEDVDKIMSQCSFTSTSYVRSATAIVSGIQVQATKPATTVTRPFDSTSTAVQFPVLEDLPFIKVDYVAGEYPLEMLSAFDIVSSAGADMRHVPENTSADEYYLQSAENTIAFARLARDAGVERFVHIGSFYWHIAPKLIEKTPYIRSRKAAAEGVASLSVPEFHSCSLGAPWTVGTVPGMHSPIFAAYVQFAEGKLGMGPSVIDGNSNIFSVQALETAVIAALKKSESVSGRTILIEGENMTFAEFFTLIFSAVGNNVSVSASDQEHPLMPESALWAGHKIKAYEPDAEEEALLGEYRRYCVQGAVERVVREHRSSQLDE
ncbi:Protein CAP22 [Fusarium oxysporum f. sp. rapae]|uniref:Protein CAP22 n=1 Tax=Fusarium oxysporum f. sp. rapae TaxID=485398 RepID=A0A8J5P8C3_FUSOX|nr:Protein CAP22 [Fusarium oxysporum f. sp. rapae]